MLKSSKAPLASTVSTPAPLAPLNLLRAGVPAREVIWFRRLTPKRQMEEIRSTTRGKLLLEKVREFASQATTASAMVA